MHDALQAYNDEMKLQSAFPEMDAIGLLPPEATQICEHSDEEGECSDECTNSEDGDYKDE